jgi:hypothetical protein
MAMLSAWLVALGNVASAPATNAAEVTIPIDPKATYLLTNQDPQAVDSLAIDLAELGLRAGDHVSLQSQGSFCFSVANCANGISVVAPPMIAVFSSSDTLLASNLLHRVPGAIAAGTPVTSLPTFFGGISTDIPEDFIIFHNPYSSVVTIPDNAQFLFVAVRDSFYGDNGSVNGDLALSIAKVPAKVAFGFNSPDVSGFPTGAAQITGGGSFDLDAQFVRAVGGFRCNVSVQQGPLTGCLDGEGVRWDTANVLVSTNFRCTGSTAEPLKTATTGAHSVVLLADFYRQGDGNDESFTARMIVADFDLAPDIPGVQNVWIQGVGCGSAIVNFNTPAQ